MWWTGQWGTLLSHIECRVQDKGVSHDQTSLMFPYGHEGDLRLIILHSIYTLLKICVIKRITNTVQYHLYAKPKKAELVKTESSIVGYQGLAGERTGEMFKGINLQPVDI